MTDCNSTDSGRVPSSVREILSRELPLADGPDWPVGPIPFFRVENMLIESHSAGRESSADIAHANYEARAMMSAVVALLSPEGVINGEPPKLCQAVDYARLIAENAIQILAEVDS